MFRVCLVDDDSLLLAGMQRALRHGAPNVELTLATGGAEALATLETRPIDLIISDLSMPGMDGQTLLAAVQTRFPHIARVLSTGGLDPYRAFDLQLIAHRVIAKPVETSTLISLMDELAKLHSEAESQSGTTEIAWGYEAARQLVNQQPFAITANIARDNPWLAVLLLQATHSGFAPSSRPLDVQTAVQELGSTRLGIMLARLKEMRPSPIANSASGTAHHAPEPPVAALLGLTREIAQHFSSLQTARQLHDNSGASAYSEQAFQSIAESAALLRAASRAIVASDVPDRDVVLQCARDAARLGVPSVVVEAVAESVDCTEPVGARPGVALRWAATLLQDNNPRHAELVQSALGDAVPAHLLDRWQAIALASQPQRTIA